MVDFDKLLAERAKKKDADTIRREAEANNQALNERNSSRDDRFWKLTVKDRKGEAVIRFLLPQNETKSIIRRDMYFVETNYGKFGCLAPESAGVKSFPREVATKCWQEFKGSCGVVQASIPLVITGCSQGLTYLSVNT